MTFNNPVQEPLPSRLLQVYIFDDAIAELDAVSLVQRQTEIVLQGKEACQFTDPKTGDEPGNDIKSFD